MDHADVPAALLALLAAVLVVAGARLSAPARAERLGFTDVPVQQRRRARRSSRQWITGGPVPRLSVGERLYVVAVARWVRVLWWAPPAGVLVLAAAALAVLPRTSGAVRAASFLVLAVLGLGVLGAAAVLVRAHHRSGRFLDRVHLPSLVRSEGPTVVEKVRGGTDEAWFEDGVELHRWWTTLPAEPSAVPALRADVMAQLGRWGVTRTADGAMTLDDVVLVVTELASNAVRHGSGRIGVELNSAPSRLEIAVTDDHAASPVRRGGSRRDLLDESGRGLQLIEAFSRSWGVSPASSGKTVWCDLGTPRFDRPAPAGAGAGPR